MTELTEDELKIVKASLNSGYGFTKTCHYIMRDVEEMSEYARTEPDFMEFCEEAVKAHTARMIMMGYKHLTELNFDKFIKQNAHMTRLIGKLTLWGEFCEAKEVTSEKLLKAVYIYHYQDEVATACGFRIDEMYDYIRGNQDINIYLTQIGFI